MAPVSNRGAYIGKEPEAIPGVWGALLDLFEQKKVRGVAFEKIFEYVQLIFALFDRLLTTSFVINRGLESAPSGLKALGARETWGKAVVRVKKENERSKL